MTPTRTAKTERPGQNGASAHTTVANGAPDDAMSRELQALRRSEAVLRDFVETSTIGLHWVGADGKILWANQAELDLLGYRREEYIGRNIAEFHADEAVINEILACLSRGDTLRDHPARLRHRDGSIRHVLINSSVLFEDGKFVHTRCFTRDVTDLKQEQEARQAQLAAELADTKLLQDISAQLIEPGDEDALYSKLVDAAATIMHSDFATMQILDPERGLKGELRLLASRGLGPEGKKVWEWVGFDTGSTCGQALRTGKRAIAPNVETCEFLAGTDGMAALLGAGIRAGQSTPLFSRSGRLLGMISSHWSQPHTPTERDLRLLDILARQAADLIERKQAEQALRESQRHLREIIEAIPAAVYTTDAEGRITFFNHAAVEFSGRVPELGTDSWCVTWKLHNMDGTPLPHDQCPMAVALKEKRPVLGCEAVAERPDGERRTFTPYPTPLFDEQGRLMGAVNMLVDITDRKRHHALGHRRLRRHWHHHRRHGPYRLQGRKRGQAQGRRRAHRRQQPAAGAVPGRHRRRRQEIARIVSPILPARPAPFGRLRRGFDRHCCGLRLGRGLRLQIRTWRQIETLPHINTSALAPLTFLP